MIILNDIFVTLSLSVSSPGKLKSLFDRGGNRTHDLRLANLMLYQRSYEVKSVRVGSNQFSSSVGRALD